MSTLSKFLLHVIELLFFLFRFSDQGVDSVLHRGDDPHFLPYRVVGCEVEILVCVCLLPVDCDACRPIWFSVDPGVEEGDS